MKILQNQPCYTIIRLTNVTYLSFLQKVHFYRDFEFGSINIFSRKPLISAKNLKFFEIRKSQLFDLIVIILFKSGRLILIIIKVGFI